MLEGKTAVITGCNRGIGKEIMWDYVKNRAKVFAVVRRESDEFKAYCEELRDAYNAEIIPVYMDLQNQDKIKAGAKEILSHKIPIDILVNNAGVALPQRMFFMTKMETIREVFDVNFYAHVLLSQILGKSMMKNKSGSIIFLSSSAAFDGGANVEYSASKAAIIGLTRRLAVELGGYGIRVNAIAPGLTDTDMGQMSEEDEAKALSMNIMGRKGKPGEIADAAVFLGSDMSSFITAQVLRVDGGLR